MSNLCSSVTEEDVLELFATVGPVKSVKMLEEAGTAKVFFVRQDDAFEAVRKYNDRRLDGKRMKLDLHKPGKSKLDGKWYSWMLEVGVKQKSLGKVVELEQKSLLRALFKSKLKEDNRAPVDFTIKV